MTLEGWRTPAARAIIAQTMAFIALVVVGAFLANNLVGNLSARSIRTGFGFLWQTAGFDVSESFIAFDGRASYGLALLVGLLNTLAVTSAAIVLSTVLGGLIGVARLSRNPLVAPLAAAYIEIIRNVPLLLQLYVWYAALTQILPADANAPELLPGVYLSKSGLHFPVLPEGGAQLFVAVVIGVALAFVMRSWMRRRQARTGAAAPVWPVLVIAIAPFVLTFAFTLSAVSFDMPERKRFGFSGGGALTPELTALLIGLSLYNAAFIAEILRGGILSVAKGQLEAASALGLKRGQTLRFVAIPQALRVAVPPLASQYLNLAKNSSLAIAIGYPDLMSIGSTIINQTGQAIEVIGLVMGVYLVISLCISAFMNWYNARIARAQ